MRYFAVIFFVILCVSCSQPPEFTLLNGREVRLSDFKGKHVIIVFWAEWCEPCQQEVPILNRLYREREQHRLEIISFSYDNIPESELLRIKREWGMDYSVANTTPMPIVPFKKPSQLPAFIHISPTGVISLPIIGQHDYEKILLLLKTGSLN